jgi:hypothetical protein
MSWPCPASLRNYDRSHLTLKLGPWPPNGLTLDVLVLGLPDGVSAMNFTPLALVSEVLLLNRASSKWTMPKLDRAWPLPPSTIHSAVLGLVPYLAALQFW